MHRGAKELCVTFSSPCLSILGVNVQWTFTKRVRAFNASVLLHTVVSYSIVLPNNSPVAVRDLLAETSDSSGLSLRQEDRKLDMDSA